MIFLSELWCVPTVVNIHEKIMLNVDIISQIAVGRVSELSLLTDNTSPTHLDRWERSQSTKEYTSVSQKVLHFQMKSLTQMEGPCIIVKTDYLLIFIAFICGLAYRREIGVRLVQLFIKSCHGQNEGSLCY